MKNHSIVVHFLWCDAFAVLWEWDQKMLDDLENSKEWISSQGDSIDEMMIKDDEEKKFQFQKLHYVNYTPSWVCACSNFQFE